MRLASLVWDLHCRGVLLEPAGDMLAVDPIEKLNEAELEALRTLKPEILRLFASGRLQLIECPGMGCRERLLLLDGESYCHSHQMSVRYVEGVQA